MWKQMNGGMAQEQATRARKIFYYDADCGFCTWTMRWLRRCDWFDRITWTSFQSLSQPPAPLTWEELDRAAYLDDGRGVLYGGFYAFQLLTLRLWPLIVLAPLFWFPGMWIPGEAVYRWVAKNRYRFSACWPPVRGADRKR
jgi:predicted DCC family thiol-disulfide oxidoreductase YuxK